jgi:hypothetical protein
VLDDGIVIDLFLYSLTKYSAIVAEMKLFFGIMIASNQLRRWNLCSLRSQNGTRYVEKGFLELELPQNLCSELTSESTGECDWA